MGNTDHAMGSTRTAMGNTDNAMGSTCTAMGKNTDNSMGSTSNVVGSTCIVTGSTCMLRAVLACYGQYLHVMSSTYNVSQVALEPEETRLSMHVHVHDSEKFQPDFDYIITYQWLINDSDIF